MAVEVFSVVTAKIDNNFLNYVVASVGTNRSIVEQLLRGMNSNLKCWQSDDESWHISGCLNNIVEAGANLLALYMRSQAAAKDNNATIDIPHGVPVSSIDVTSPTNLDQFVAKVEKLDGEDDLQVQDSSQKMFSRENADQIQSETGNAEMERNEDRGGMKTRQSSRLAARKQAYKHHKSYCCRVCKKSFSSSTNLRRHVRANHESGRFQCQYCPAAFKRCDSLLRHRRTAHADLQCTNCRKVFKNIDLKNSHVCKGRSSEKLMCNVCRKSFISRSNLNKHIRLTHGAVMFPCKECGKVFRQSDSLTLHTWKNHHRFVNNFCPHCGSVHETAALLGKHMLSVHGKKVAGMSPAKRSPSPENGDDSLNMNDMSDGDDGDNTDDTGQQTFVQASANGETSFLDAVPDSEIQSAIGTDIYSDIGQFLNGTKTTRRNKTRDSVAKHRTGNEASAEDGTGRTNSCHVCHKSFSSESNLRRHIRVNHESSRFPCKECPAVFKRIDSLVRHKRANHAELCCSVCRGVFDSVETKSSHDCTRPSEKSLSCEVCGKSFANRSNLNKHTYLVHGGVKFHCNECPKFFRRSMTLTLHMWKSHSRFTCPQCNVVLETAALLCEHMSTIHGRKATKNLSEICRRPASRPVAVADCTRCNKTFSSRSNLAKHIRVVHGHPRWHCSMCERTFTAELQLSLHIRTFHQHLPLKLVVFT